MTSPLQSIRYPEERRVATVLFADVHGFTHLAEEQDFEAISDLIKEVWVRLDTIIESNGGYIDKHIGDAVMAVWGAPYAGEGDAERAVTTAMKLQEFNPGIRTRIFSPRGERAKDSSRGEYRFRIGRVRRTAG